MGERVTLKSSLLADDRQLQILLPENYQANPQASYPVIYLLDGDYNFHSVSGLLDMLANKGQLIPEVILVGIADKGTSSYRSYMTPEAFSANTSKGKQTAELFLRYLNQEVKPYIKQHYRTADTAILVGQSMGGLFVLNSLLDEPESFSHYVAISPSVWVSDSAIVDKAKQTLGSKSHQPVSLYLSLADEQQMGQYGFINELDIKPLANLNWQFRHYPDENHGSIGPVALRDSLKHIFAGWYLSEKQLEQNTPAQTLAYFEQIQDRFALSQPLPTAAIHVMIRQYYRQQKADEVPGFIADAIGRFPASKQTLIAKQADFAGYYDSPAKALELLKSIEQEYANSIEHLKAIAAVYEQLENSAQAKAYYQKALSLAKKQQANQWQLSIIEAKLRSLR